MKRRPLIFIVVFLLTCAGAAAGEGERIASVRVTGNRFFSSGEVRETLGFVESAVWSAPAESAAVTRLLDRYAVVGYVEARIDLRVARAGEGMVDVEVSLDEGPALSVVRLAVDGASAFPVDGILSRFETRTGRPLSSEHLDRDFDRLLHRYAGSGYPFARVLLSGVTRETEPDGIGLDIRVVEGPFLLLGDLHVTGNRSTKPYVLRRLSGLRFGEPYDQDAVDDAPRRLLRSGLFRIVSEPSTRIDWKTKEAIVEMEVERAMNNRVAGVVGYAPDTDDASGGFTGFFDVAFGNILGTARSAEIHWDRISPETRAIHLAYREPWVFGTPFSLGGEVTQDLRDSSYSRFSGNITAAVDLSGNVSATFLFGGEKMNPRSETGNIPESRRLRGGAGFLYDGRDFPSNPTGGLLMRLGVEYAERRIDEDPARGIERETVQQATLDCGFGHYRRTSRKTVLSLEVFGLGRYTNAPYVPVYDQFYLGGARTLRGYEEDRFLGSVTAWSRLESRYLLGPFSRVFLFLDSGYIHSRGEDRSGVVVSTEQIRIGYGFGIRVESGIGLLGIDYGIGEEDGFLGGKLHVGVESSF